MRARPASTQKSFADASLGAGTCVDVIVSSLDASAKRCAAFTVALSVEVSG